ncbi:MAG TPA: hypothetical protein VJG83_03660 [archaeon]|nr:hypothetical protein [archaeon]
MSGKPENLMYFFLGARYGLPLTILIFAIAGFLFFLGLVFLAIAYFPK